MRLGMTDAEIEAWLALERAGARIAALPQLHPMAEHEAAHALHRIEDLLLSRPGMRAQGWGSAPGELPDADERRARLERFGMTGEELGLWYDDRGPRRPDARAAGAGGWQRRAPRAGARPASRAGQPARPPRPPRRRRLISRSRSRSRRRPARPRPRPRRSAPPPCALSVKRPGGSRSEKRPRVVAQQRDLRHRHACSPRSSRARPAPAHRSRRRHDPLARPDRQPRANRHPARPTPSACSSTSGMIRGAEFATIPRSDGVPPTPYAWMPTASGGAPSLSWTQTGAPLWPPNVSTS